MKRPSLAAVFLLLAAWTQAQADKEAADSQSKPNWLTASNWSQIRPDFGYLNGCTTGYRSFSFTPDGYFVFNRNVRGTWRLTPQGYLLLHTKSGQTLHLFLEGSTLTYRRKNTATAQELEAATSPPATMPDDPGINSANAIPVAPGLPPPAAFGSAKDSTTAPIQSTPTNQPYNSVASGALRFRVGDQFQVCIE